VDTAHVAQEAFILLIALLAFSWIAISLLKRNSEIKALHLELDEIRRMPQPESEQVIEAKRRLSEVIAMQFDEWNLTRSEKEVGLLLLKGFSLREISSLRGTAEKTIRQQASSIYQKTGLSGRHAFSAWFIEDIL
jgi:DNA-binding CsgD family transcriptional regulator